MRIETITAWTFVGIGLLTAGALLHALHITAGGFVMFLTITGWVYLIIGVALTIIHDRHMNKRTRARQE